MRLQIALTFLFFLVPETAYATTRTAPSCSLADVQNTVNASASGDTVLVPGPCVPSWSTWVTVNLGITIQPTGGAVTISNYGFSITAPAAAEVRITGFTFTFGNNSSNSGQARAFLVNNTNTTAASTWRIDNNTFTESNASILDVWIAVYGNGPGLMDHNVFTSGEASEPIHVYGPCGPDGCATGPNGCVEGNLTACQTGWTDTIVPGGPLMVFIENNTFNELGTDGAAKCATEAFGGAREVVRYNTFNYCYVDIHGTGYVAGRWWEIYNNIFNTPAGQGPGAGTCQLRGGTGVFFNNSLGGSGNAGSCQMEAEIRTANINNTTWPQMWNVGSGIGGWQNLHSTCSGDNTAPAQAWNNGSIVISGTTYTWQNGQSGNTFTPSLVQLNRDFFTGATQPSNIHWMEATGDSCSTTYTYTSYTYPHPLISGPPTTLTPPTISPISGGYTTPQTVTISAASGATICYTTNGSAPTAATAGTCDAGSTTYTGSFSQSIPGIGVTISAIATEATFTNSAVTQASYVINNCNQTSWGAPWGCVSTVNAAIVTPATSLNTGNFPANPPTGSLIIVFQRNGGASCTTPTDTLRNTYHAISTATVSALSLFLCDFYAQVPTGGADSVTCGASASASSIYCDPINLTGQATATLIDQICTQSNAVASSGSNNAVCSASITPTVNNELILATSYGDTINTTFSPGTSFTFINPANHSRSEYYVQPSAATITPSQSIDSSLNYGLLAVSLEPFGAGGPVTITSAVPISGVWGTVITITGTNFGSSQGTSTVTFNNAPATCLTWSATQLMCYVPSVTNATGNLVVTVAGSASNPVNFVLTPLPITARPGGVF